MTAMLPRTTDILPGSEQESPGRVRLDYLDGLRGLAALYVAISHIVGESVLNLSPPMQSTLFWLRPGRLAVDIFIVLSGYCLMLPVARSKDGQLRGGFRHYIARRARRILPPYYAALLLTLALMLASRTGLHYLQGVRDSQMALDFAPGNLLAHLLLLHNFSPRYNMAIDGPLWSVATEWQIYFLFPLLLLPLWRRLGLWAAVLGGMTVGLLPHLLLPAGHNLDWMAPWYLGLFAMGMAGAVINFQPKPIPQPRHAGVPWGWLSLLLTLIAMVVTSQGMSFYTRYAWLFDPVAGLAATCFLIHCTGTLQKTASTRTPVFWGLRLLQSRPALLLGTFSYSLYLTHRPAMLKVYPILSKLHLSPTSHFLVSLVVCIPWVLLIGYGFHLLIERRFMPGSPKSERQTEIATLISPAP